MLHSHRGLRLRNYVPEDEDLKRRRVPQAKPVAGMWAALSSLCLVNLREGLPVPETGLLGHSQTSAPTKGP